MRTGAKATLLREADIVVIDRVVVVSGQSAFCEKVAKAAMLS